jgi:hypothetical protein
MRVPTGRIAPAAKRLGLFAGGLIVGIERHSMTMRGLQGE